ncbi:MAG: DNA-3-methyladenine glycosylase 2 family protein [Oscillospiraceae bacterium]|nr:DNA-3-methyladenine glycosylase 2 family protein [Oscillospiraceae bacterium]
MDITVGEDRVSFCPNDDFDLKRIFECGQCFRWNEEPDGAYTGVALGRAARISKRDGVISISGSEEDFRTIWRSYFDLDRSYSAIRESLCIDDYMRCSTQFGAGIRILRQDRWEALCSFIISQCNNIPRIKGIVERLCGLYGEPMDFEGRVYYSFPPASKLAALTPEDLAPIRAGYRADYIIRAARDVDSGNIDMDELSEMDLEGARRALMKMRGVGKKVADCVILFGLRIPTAFPMDTWMKKAVAEHYGKDFDPAIFGEYAGLAQQYMFYYQRENSKGVK